ncbi:MAG: S8 family peptidase [Bacillaceae bacterium]|nr:S8 family peptidase [Bacillaceae bacterium]
MLGFPLIQWVRQSAHKLDSPLRKELSSFYRYFRWIPCIVHNRLERLLKKLKKIPVIIEFEDGETAYAEGAGMIQLLKQHQEEKDFREFSHIAGVSARLSLDELEQLLTREGRLIRRVYYDRPVQALLDHAGKAIHAPVFSQRGLEGKGVTIAVVDTGIYPHDDLTRPENRIKAFKDFVHNRVDPYDDNGHGTHCAGDAAGNGYASQGKYRGPAPAANLVGVKVLDRLGSGQLSRVIAGVEWCIENKDRYGIDIISLSLGSEATQPAEQDPMVKIVEKAWENGIVVCAAAGNSGPDTGTISSPGTSAKVITVGAMDDKNTDTRADDNIAEFSSRGPTIDNLEKPDILAPGVDIVSLRSPQSYLDVTMKKNRIGKRYFTMSGTSMATPICAGVAALIKESKPNWSPDQIKQLLLDTAEDWGLSPNVQGKGYLDAFNIYEQIRR